jgi:hypothetical protein
MYTYVCIHIHIHITQRERKSASTEILDAHKAFQGKDLLLEEYHSNLVIVFTFLEGQGGLSEGMGKNILTNESKQKTFFMGCEVLLSLDEQKRSFGTFLRFNMN